MQIMMCKKLIFCHKKMNIYLKIVRKYFFNSESGLQER